MEDMERYLRPTPAIDCDHPSIVEKAKALTGALLLLCGEINH